MPEEVVDIFSLCFKSAQFDLKLSSDALLWRKLQNWIRAAANDSHHRLEYKMSNYCVKMVISISHSPGWFIVIGLLLLLVVAVSFLPLCHCLYLYLYLVAVLNCYKLFWLVAQVYCFPDSNRTNLLLKMSVSPDSGTGWTNSGPALTLQ